MLKSLIDTEIVTLDLELILGLIPVYLLSLNFFKGGKSTLPVHGQPAAFSQGCCVVLPTF